MGIRFHHRKHWGIYTQTIAKPLHSPQLGAIGILILKVSKEVKSPWQEREGTFKTYCIGFLLHWQRADHLRKGYCSSQFWRIQSWRKMWQQRGWGEVTFYLQSGREMNVHAHHTASHIFPIQSGTPFWGMVLPTFRMGLPSSVKPLWKCPHISPVVCLLAKASPLDHVGRQTSWADLLEGLFTETRACQGD